MPRGQQFLTNNATFIHVAVNDILFVPAGFLALPLYIADKPQEWAHVWSYTLFIPDYWKALPIPVRSAIFEWNVEAMNNRSESFWQDRASAVWAFQKETTGVPDKA